MTVFASCSRGCAFEVACLTDAERERVVAAHNRRYHGETTPVVQLPSVVAWTEALEAARVLAATGEEFLLSQLPDVAHHKTSKGRLAQELHRLNIAHPVRYDRSRRPGTKASAVAVWHEDRDRCLECPRLVVPA